MTEQPEEKKARKARTRDGTLESYPAEYIEFLKKASISPTEVTFDTKEAAFYVRARINSMRSIMKREGHSLYPSIAKAVMRIEERGGRGILMGAPRDHTFLSAFHEAGIQTEQLDHDPLASLDDFFGSSDQQGE